MLLASRRDPISAAKLNFNTILVLRPEQALRFSWEIFMMSSLIVLGVLIPYAAAFAQNNIEFVSNIDYYSISIFSLDILVTLNSGIYVHGELCMKRTTILKEYLKFWFWIDFVSTFPFDQILIYFMNEKELLSAVSLGKHFNILKMIKLLKLVRLSKLKYMIMRIEDHTSSKKILSLVKILKSILYLFLVAHCCACLMFLVSSEDMSPDSFAGLIEFSLNGHIQDPFIMYIYSLYWAFVTMACIGYGDLSPHTTYERLLGIAIMNVTSVVFGYIIGNVGTIIEKHTSKDKERRELLVNINKIMKIHSLSEDLKRKSRKYINYVYTRSKNRVDLKKMLEVLSQPLREEIFSHLNGNTVLELKFLADMPIICISRISRILKPQVNSPHDVILNENEDSPCMFFITKGTVDVIDVKTRSSIKILCDKAYFGEIGLFSSKPRCASIISISFLETLCLQRIDLAVISAQFPEMNKKLQSLYEAAVAGDLTPMKIECYLCKCIGHIAKNCKKMTERENLQVKWLKRRKESQIINAEDYNFDKKYVRDLKKLRVDDINTRNIWGVRRKLKDLYPKKRKFQRTVKGYIKEFPRKSDEDMSITSERCSLFSQESEISFILSNKNNLKAVISSSSDSDSDKAIDKSRNIAFDSTLLESKLFDPNDI